MEEEAGINYVILVVVAIAILLIVIVFVGSREVNYSETSETINAIPTGQSVNIDVENKINNSSESKSAELVDSSSSSMGEASILRDNNKLYLIINANLADPEEDMFYEAWLVDNNNSYYSMGALTKSGIDGYSLEFSTNDEFAGYNTIIVTKEEIKDMTPEEQMLEARISE